MAALVFFWFALALAAVQSKYIRYDDYKVFGVNINSQADHENIHKLKNGLDIDMWNEAGIGETANIMVSPHIADKFEQFIRSNGLNTTLKIENFQQLIDNERKTVAARADPFGWTQYYSYEQIYEWLDSMLVTHSNVLTNFDIGKSFEGRPIRGVKISHKAGNPVIFIESHIHANEWITSATATWLINELLTSTDATVQELARNIDWYILPILNVDGFVFTHTTDRMWRKTRKPTSLFCHGTDPNRNFKKEWRQHNGASNNPCDRKYAGEGPESEIEIAQFARFIESIVSSVKLYISFHSHGQKILTPYGHTHQLPENHYDMMDIGLRAHDAILLRNNRDYEVGPIAEVMFIASGSSIDWVYSIGGPKLVYAFEFRDRSDGKEGGPILPAEQILPNALEIFDGVKAMIARARELKYL